MEALVGLLRDCNQATPVDVELFFKDHKKLSNKLKRMESHGLKYDNVKKHTDELKGILDKFVDVPKPPKGEFNIGPMKPLIEWGINFGTAAEMDLRRDNLIKEIDSLKKTRESCDLLIKRNEAISQDINEENMAEYYESQELALKDRKLKIDEIAVTDQGQAVDYQKKLHGFEKAYFEKLLEAVKGQ